ncbi:hypothetical protein FKM82_012950 [Ascaphus truei]
MCQSVTSATGGRSGRRDKRPLSARSSPVVSAKPGEPESGCPKISLAAQKLPGTVSDHRKNRPFIGPSFCLCPVEPEYQNIDIKSQ